MSSPDTRIGPHGFLQYRSGGRWCFHVTAYDDTPSGHDGTCLVAHKDGPQRVTIDAQDRILIGRRRYGWKDYTH